MKRWSWFLIFAIVGTLLIWGLNYFIFPKNDGKKYVEEYINNSVTIDVIDSNTDAEFNIKSVYTGIRFAFLRGKISGKKVETISFYCSNNKKYFILTVINPGIPGQFDALSTCALGATIKAKVNQYDLNNPSYGTKENPIPIFTLEIPEFINNPDYQEARITDTQYRNTVEFYLSHMMSKEEFKERFEKTVN